MDVMGSWGVLLYVTEWMIRLTMLVVAPRRRPPSTAMAWLLVIFIWPWPGLIIFAVFGTYRLPRSRFKWHARMLERIQDVIRSHARRHPEVGQPTVKPELLAAVRLAENLGGLPIIGGNKIELLANTRDLFDRIVVDIDGARDFVHVLFYIYVNDGTGRRVADALLRAAKRGVTCRVLVDAVGSRQMLKTLGAEMAAEGVTVHAALPVGLFRRSMARMDMRNHRKLVIIDGSVAYSGSHNCVDASYGRNDLAWHDLSVRLAGPAVLELQSVFVADWFFDTNELLDADRYFPMSRVTGKVPMQVLPSGPNYPTENYQRLVVAALHGAQRRVVMTTPYFVPDDALIQAIETAVLRGVQVDLIVPRRSDQIMVGAASRAYYDPVLESGANLYLYEDGLVHAKTMTVDDDVAFVGSSNFDIRSFALNFELNMVFYDSEVTRRLLAQQEAYMAKSTLLDKDEWLARPAVARALQNTAKLLSPLL